VDELLDGIALALDADRPEPVALVGIGNLGRALLAFFQGRRPRLAIAAAFDADPTKVGRVIHGCRCHEIDRIDEVVAAEGIRTAIIAVPASEAQSVADRLTAAGILGVLNFSPAVLRTPPQVFVENIDMTTALEKVAYFARPSVGSQETRA
jgi:redox-sensing transcriptional repressor